MQESSWARKDGSLWCNIKIPSETEFLTRYHLWIYKKVSDRFRRDKDRVDDTVQNVRVRLMQKDFIGRWFFKHLTHELVDRKQAERMLGGAKLKFISAVSPVVGKRAESDSLWKVSDLLDYAQFDHDRYYYSVQGHTISSDSVLKLLGYPPGSSVDSRGRSSYNVLKSLYKQGRLKPAELTQHECSEVLTYADSVDGKCSVPGCGKKHLSRGFCTAHYGRRVVTRCPICDKGRASLSARGLSLADDWTKSAHVSSLRWEDSQLRPFLRQWRRKNLVTEVPLKIVRPEGQISPYQGIEAGLLKYAWIIINNEVVNDFKRMTRTLDSTYMVFNDGMSPDIGDADMVAWEVDEGDKPYMVVKDSSAMDVFNNTENGIDIVRMAHKANLSAEEQDVIVKIDLNEMNVREYAEEETCRLRMQAMAEVCCNAVDEVPCGVCDECKRAFRKISAVSVAHIHRVRGAALDKMRNADVSDSVILKMMIESCCKHKCEVKDILGPDRFGPCVTARIEFFRNLSRLGLSIDEMAYRTGMSSDRVSVFVGRAEILDEPRSCERNLRHQGIPARQ